MFENTEGAFYLASLGCDLSLSSWKVELSSSFCFIKFWSMGKRSRLMLLLLIARGNRWTLVSSRETQKYSCGPCSFLFYRSVFGRILEHGVSSPSQGGSLTSWEVQKNLLFASRRFVDGRCSERRESTSIISAQGANNPTTEVQRSFWHRE